MSVALPVGEVRLLTFPKETLTDVIITVDKAMGGWLAHGVIHGVVLHGSGNGPMITVRAARGGGTAVDEMHFRPEQVAAALIRYCQLVKIPLPRKAQKSLEVHGDTLVMRVALQFTVVAQTPRVGR